MSFFRSTPIYCSYEAQWKDVVAQIQGWYPDHMDYQSPLPRQVAHPLEAKALYVLTIARRLVRSAYRLAEQAKGNWKVVFVEATSLLFPMVELVGHARLNDSEVQKAYGKDDVSAANLWAGLWWLHKPMCLPHVKDNQLKYETERLAGKWQIGHLIALRNYYLHGTKEAKDRKGNAIPIADMMDFEQPRTMAELAQEAMRVYWEQLKQDDGTTKWVERLAHADIQPLIIQGSGIFEQGMVDPDIVDYLESHVGL